MNKFIDLLKNEDSLYVQEDLKNQFPTALTYGYQTSSTLFVYDVRLKEGYYIFNVNYKGVVYENFEFHLPGRHNLLNAAGAILSCLEWGVSFEKLKSALANFNGVKRRFEIHYNDGQRIYVDDYAHHPNEIKETIHSNWEKVAQKNVTAKEEYEKKILQLEIKAKEYQSVISKKNTELLEYKNKARIQFLKEIQNILAEYSKDNSLSVILKKESILIGKTNLDITNDILELYNKKIKKIEVQ